MKTTAIKQLHKATSTMKAYFESGTILRDAMIFGWIYFVMNSPPVIRAVIKWVAAW